jgi:cytochrome c oxidase subunit II
VRRTVAAAFASLLALAAAGVAQAGNGGVAPVSPVSPNAGRIDDTYWLVMGFTGAIFFLVEIALIAFIIRFRSRGRARTVEGPQIIGHSRLEMIWTAAPIVILAMIAAFVFYKLPGIKNTPSASAANRLAIRVEGHQFYWRFVYPDGTTAIDELTVPVGRVVTLAITTPDVAHSWWVPALGGKTDAIPGRTNHTWFIAEKAGRFRGQCAELCGIQHAVMRVTVHAVPTAEYTAWLQKQHSGQSGLGAQEFAGVCAKCHGFQGEGYIGPNLQGGTAANAAALAKTIRNGSGLMPAVARDWTGREVNAVVHYVLTQVAKGGASGGS